MNDSPISLFLSGGKYCSLSMKFSFLLIACALFVLLFSSCRKEEPDRIKPLITGISSVSGDTIYSGQSLDIEFTVADETGLSQIKFDVKNVGGTPSEDTTVSAYWNYTEIADLNGVDFHDFVSLVVPANAAAGIYIVSVTAVDKSGNASLSDTLALVIRNSNDLFSPVVIITSPAEGASVPSGSALFLGGSISDNNALRRLGLRVLTGGSVISSEFYALSSAQLELNDSLNTEAWVAGNYIIELTAFDRVLNKTVMIRNVVKQ